MSARGLGVLLPCLRLVTSFYLPGLSPVEYELGATVEMKVNKLTSVKTQLPYDYYTLPFCRPRVITTSAENLGEILEGDRIENSPYEIRMLEDMTCKVVCKQALTVEMRKQFQNMIKDEYLVNWIVDNLPAATKYARAGKNEVTYINGFPVGVQKGETYYLHNHVRINLKYHTNPDKYFGYRIVGFEIEPFSMHQAVKEKDGVLQASCQDGDAAPIFDLDVHDELTFTYDVAWAHSEIRWASRYRSFKTVGRVRQLSEDDWRTWTDPLVLHPELADDHALLVRHDRSDHPQNDSSRHHQVQRAGLRRGCGGRDGLEVGPWRCLPETQTLQVAVSVGSGVQIVCMSVVTLFLALLGVLSPVHRGALLQSCLLLFTFMGFFAGYVASRLYKTFHGADWKQMTLLTAFLYPGIFFGIFFILNLLIWGQRSSGAVPFTTMFAMLCLWFGVSVPLVCLGAFFGFRKANIELPVRTNQIPRQIPVQSWFMKPAFTIMVGGVLPFGAVFTELFFIMSSIWQHQFYYLFGFLALVLVILLVTCAEIAMALTYFQLTAEDYNWWWRSFLSCASSGFYVFGYAILYFSSRLQIEKPVSTMLYFGYMLIMSILFFLLTGSIGLLSSFSFVRAIYSSIKID